MNNFEQFNILVDEYLEQDKTYELQIKNFKNFLVKKIYKIKCSIWKEKI